MREHMFDDDETATISTAGIMTPKTTISSSDIFICKEHDEPTVVVLVEIIIDPYHNIRRDMQIKMRQNMPFKQLVSALKAQISDDRNRRLECAFITQYAPQPKFARIIFDNETPLSLELKDGAQLRFKPPDNSVKVLDLSEA